MSSNNSRRKYSKEFILESVQLALSKGDNASAVASDLGIDPGMLNRWIREYKADSQYAFPSLYRGEELGVIVNRLQKKYELESMSGSSKIDNFILTTKRGSKCVKVSYDGRFSVQKVEKYVDPLNAEDYMHYYNVLNEQLQLAGHRKFLHRISPLG